MVISDLPQEILIDIFSRLPEKSVGKCRCLSKPWRDLLSSSGFIKSHLNRKTHKENLIAISPGHSIHSIAVTKGDIVSTKLDLPVHWIDVLGSCDGLVLLVSDRDEKFLVNPITLQQEKIPDSPLHESLGRYGFGYDSSIDDYKIVRLSYHDTQYEDGVDFVDTFLEVYYVKRGFWKRVENSNYVHVGAKHHSGALLNGAIHWLANSRESSFAGIAAFDLANEVFSHIAPPGGLTMEKFGCHFLVVCDGCLCIVDLQTDSQIDVWIMKEYGLAESWTKFSIDDDYICDIVTYPLCFIGDEEIVLLTGEENLVVYNLKEGTFRDMILDGSPDITAGVNFTESLVSPDFRRIPEEEVNY